ncbi:MAG: methyltransferase domain-containing protein [Chromatiales bacterium]|nr:methyltransferase domain-containing protein [Chromatiales bacterium]
MKDLAALTEKQTETVVAHYARLADKYEKRWSNYTRVSLELLATRAVSSGEESLLDVACGTGRLAMIIRQRHPGVRITGRDLSPDMLRVARSRLPADHITQWEQGRMEELPYEDASFDVVTCASAFHLVTDQRRALAEMVRVVRPGGTICIVDWCRQYPQIQFMQWLARLAGRQYRNILTQSELTSLMQAAGLKVESSEKFNATWFWAMMCLVGRKAGDQAVP